MKRFGKTVSSVVFGCLALLAVGSAAVADELIMGWGSNSFGQCNVQTPPMGIQNTQIANSWGRGFALRSDGTVASWGDATSIPALPPGIVYSSMSHRNGLSFGLRSDGTIVSWGFAFQPQELVVPALPPGLSYQKVAASGHLFNSAALRSDGKIVMWGNTPYQEISPPSGVTFTTFSVGQNHLVAIADDGTFVTAGNNFNGQRDVPVFAPGEYAVAVSCGSSYAAYLGSNGNVVAVGLNNFGQCNVPSLPPGAIYTAISAGHEHCLAVRSDGNVVAWGRNLEGECDVLPPPEGMAYTDVSAAIGFSLAKAVTIIDANHNGVPDAFDIASQTSRDCNGDGIPDECQHLNTPVDFDGSPSIWFSGYYWPSNYVEVPYSAANNSSSFTVELWVKYSDSLDLGIFRSPLTSRGSGLTGYLFYLTPSDHWQYWCGSGPEIEWNVLDGPVVEPGSWTHLAATHDDQANVSRFYVNGVEVSSASELDFVPNQSAPLRIAAGTTETFANYLFPGQIDEVRIWDHVRSAGEIAQAMNERLSGSEIGLNSLYHLDAFSYDANLDITSVFDSAPAHGNADGISFGELYLVDAVNCISPCEGFSGIFGDMNGDQLVDGDDIQQFVTAVFAAGASDVGTCAADMNSDGYITSDDVPFFVSTILTP